MVKSETRRDAEILVKNPILVKNSSPLVKSFETQKSKNQTTQKRDFETYYFLIVHIIIIIYF